MDREVEWLQSWPPEEQGERALELPRAVRVALHREENVNRQGDGERALIVPVRAYRPLEALRGQ